jgi:hypothetical protein
MRSEPVLVLLLFGIEARSAAPRPGTREDRAVGRPRRAAARTDGEVESRMFRFARELEVGGGDREVVLATRFRMER